MDQISFSEIGHAPIVELKSGLALGVDTFKAGNERAGASISLQQGCLFLQRLPHFNELVSPLLSILCSFELLDDGVHSDIFSPCSIGYDSQESIPSNKTLSGAERLSAGLRQAYCIQGRRGFVAAIDAFVIYIDTHPELGPSLCVPLRQLSGSLKRLDFNIVDPLVTPKTVRHRRQYDTYRHIVRATVVLCVNVLHKKAKVSLPTANRMVASRVKAFGYSLGGHSLTSDAKVIQRWRESLSKHREPSIFRNAYDALWAEISDRNYSTAEAAWAELGPALERIIENHRLRRGPPSPKNTF